MKQLVCISKTPETTTQIKLGEDGKAIDMAGVNFIVNPYDEWYALVRALELKEQVGGTVTVINVGDASNDVIIRKALAIGADDAIRVDGSASSAISVAKDISAQAQGVDYDIIYTGKESIDFNGSQTGAMVAELLNLPFVSQVNDMAVEGNKATVSREIEGGVEKIEISTPFVLSASKGLAEQRIPNMRGIMMSKRKPLSVVPSSNETGSASVSQYELPAGKAAVKMIDPENMDELVRLLQEEAKVL